MQFHRVSGLLRDLETVWSHQEEEKTEPKAVRWIVRGINLCGGKARLQSFLLTQRQVLFPHQRRPRFLQDPTTLGEVYFPGNLCGSRFFWLFLRVWGRDVQTMKSIILSSGLGAMRFFECRYYFPPPFTSLQLFYVHTIKHLFIYSFIHPFIHLFIQRASIYHFRFYNLFLPTKCTEMKHRHLPACLLGVEGRVTKRSGFIPFMCYVF